METTLLINIAFFVCLFFAIVSAIQVWASLCLQPFDFSNGFEIDMEKDKLYFPKFVVSSMGAISFSFGAKTDLIFDQVVIETIFPIVVTFFTLGMVVLFIRLILPPRKQ